MLFYIALLCIVTFFSYFVSFSRNRNTVQFAKFITFNLLFIPAAIRYGIGVDFTTYLGIFDVASQGETSFQNIQLDYGWYLLNRIVYLCGGSAQIVIALAAFFSIFLVFVETENKKWFIYAPVFVLLFYTWIFTTIRQMLVVCMIFYAIQNYCHNKKSTAIFIVILSIFFHKSALLYIPIFLLIHLIVPNKKRQLCIFFISLIFGIVIFPLITNEIFAIIEKTRYYYYVQYGHNAINAAKASTGIGRIIRYTIYLLLLYYTPPKEKYKKCSTLFLIYIITDILSQSIILLGRIGRALLFVFIPMFWNVWIYNDDNRKRRIYIYAICYIILFLLEIKGGFHGSIPYQTIFSK